MKKRNLQSIAILGVILGVNLVVGLLAGVAFMLFIFKDDPILAAIPAALALPGVLLQPWFVLFSLMPGGILLAPVLTTVVSVPIYMLLDRTGKLEGKEHRPCRNSNRPNHADVSKYVSSLV